MYKSCKYAALNCFAMEEEGSPFLILLTENPDHVYFGPEFFLFDLSSHFNGVHVKGTKVFLGLSLDMNILNPRRFTLEWILRVQEEEIVSMILIRGDEFSKTGGLIGFGNIEFIGRYRCSSQKWLVTPCLVLDGYSFGYEGHDHSFYGGMSYLAGSSSLSVSSKLLV